MHEYTLHSHKYTDLTNYEIEKYLEHNDIIVIPAGSFSFESGFSQTDLDSFPCTYQRLFAGNGNGVL